MDDILNAPGDLSKLRLVYLDYDGVCHHDSAYTRVAKQ